MRVTAVHGFERLSRLFSYAVEGSVPREREGSIARWVGCDATLIVRSDGGSERAVHGVVARAMRIGRAGDRVHVAVDIAPRLARLAGASGRRVFSTSMLYEIARVVLGAHGIGFAWRVRPEPPIREHRVQAGETDLAFLMRVAADDGVHFFFEHRAAESILVFANRWDDRAVTIDADAAPAAFADDADVDRDAPLPAGSFAGVTPSLAIAPGIVVARDDAGPDDPARLVVAEVHLRITAASPGPRAEAEDPSALARFRAVPATPFERPARLAKPRIRLQLARVVGPRIGEPFVDDFGRIQVELAWDHGGALPEHRTLWVSPIGGDRAGAAADDPLGWFPVGSDVLVDFIDGDIDRPAVTIPIASHTSDGSDSSDTPSRASWISESPSSRAQPA